jgi:hypothetical protein
MHLDPTSGWPSFKARKGNGAEHNIHVHVHVYQANRVVLWLNVKWLFKSGAVPLYHSLVISLYT